MATATALLTIEEYLAPPDDGTSTELVRGRIIEMPPPGSLHGRFAFRFGYHLGHHVIERGLGEIITNDSGVITHRDPDSLRGPDVAYHPAAKLPPMQDWPTYFAFVPDLIAEVRSPSDRWIEVLQKASEYLTAGELVVVLLDPPTRSVHVFREDQPPQKFGPEDTLTFPNLLGDFAVVVGRIFD